MTIFLTIIITLVVWQLLCVLFAGFFGDGDNYVYFSTFILSSLFVGVVKPFKSLNRKIFLNKYNKTHKLYFLYEYNEETKKYLMITSVVIENDFAKQFNIKEDKNNSTDKYIVVPTNTLIKNLHIISECRIDRTFFNGIFDTFSRTYIENYMI